MIRQNWPQQSVVHKGNEHQGRNVKELRKYEEGVAAQLLSIVSYLYRFHLETYTTEFSAAGPRCLRAILSAAGTCAGWGP